MKVQLYSRQRNGSYLICARGALCYYIISRYPLAVAQGDSIARIDLIGCRVRRRWSLTGAWKLYFKTRDTI